MSKKSNKDLDDLRRNGTNVSLRISKNERRIIEEKAAEHKISMVELIVRAVAAYEGKEK